MRALGILLLSVAFISVKAQEVLMLEDAMKIAIENNLGLKMVTNQQQQVENMATYGNAGLMPSVNVNGGLNYSSTSTDIEFAGQAPLENLEAHSLSYNANVGVNYTVFNGFGAINTYKKLNSQTDVSAIQTRLSIESTLLQVCNVYYEVARQQQQYDIAKKSLAISKERLKRLEAGREYGVSTSLEVLNATVDMNTDSSNVLNQEVALKTAKRNLNMLLARDLTTDFDVSEELQLNESLLLDDVNQKAASNNINLLLTQSNITVAELDEKISKASYLPRVSLNAGYGYNYSESDASLVLNQSSLGFSGGVSLAWNLFDGFRKKTAIENAQLTLATNQLKVEEAKLTVQKDVLNAYDVYQQNLVTLKMEDQSVAAAQLNFDRSQELYNQGQITTTQFREAQLNLNRAKSRKANAEFVAKVAEIQLIRLKGELIQ